VVVLQEIRSVNTTPTLDKLSSRRCGDVAGNRDGEPDAPLL